MGELRSNREWIFWGKHDPLYAISTLPGKQIGGEAPWSAEEFYETGRRYFADVHRQWQQFGIGSEHCVEIGCGSGRITRQLAQHFRKVTAVDVSPAQIESAQRMLAPHADNISFALVTEPKLPIPDGSCDGFFSCEVFQHLDPASALGTYLREAHRVMRPRGTVCFQVPLRGVHAPSFLSSPLRNALLQFLRRLGRRRMMIYRQYDAQSVLRMLSEAGFHDAEIRIFRAEEERGYPAYFFARKR